MPLQATSGAASYDAFGGGVAAVPTYIEEIFGTFLYTGNGSTQTITNGIDLAGEGGMTWIKSRSKSRSAAYAHRVFDTVRGATKFLVTNDTLAEDTNASTLTAFTSSGFSVGASTAVGENGTTYASWTFRKQPKFFDVVTGTQTVEGNVTLNHNLGSVPGVIIVKNLTGDNTWNVYHRSLGTGQYLILNNTDAADSGYAAWGGVAPTATQFTIGWQYPVGTPFVAYLFAHNAGGFGLSGEDNVISCGSWTGTGSGDYSGPTVDLGYEPQWILFKNATASSGDANWNLYDNMRGLAMDASQRLMANSSSAEAEIAPPAMQLNATGFKVTNGAYSASGQTYIYIAIRRGPMKVPESGTSVYMPLATPATTEGNVGFPADLAIAKYPIGSQDWLWGDRLRNAILYSNSTVAENGGSGGGNGPKPFDTQNGVKLTGITASDYDFWMMRRAPGFFDEVCYTGTGSARTVAHNLAAVPELMIVKRRDSTGGWYVYTQALGATKFLGLQSTSGGVTGSTVWNDTAPTSSLFTVGTTTDLNASGGTYVAYLFATCPGVSKVGSYTGTGTTQTINCGFTGGSRFVMIKRINSTGDWYVWDSARGIVSGNDPHLSLNTTAAEVTTDDSVDTDSTGFVVNQVSATNVNVSSATYIFLAIA